ncbi:MAG: SoxR reducing system RseC family protein [Bacteroidales bacterium]|nr:SoxR reducing system RseC family protein [Bacteroidales bacterium]
MNASDCYEQQGLIEDINEGLITVNVKNTSLCADCHAKGACGFFDIQKKSIQIFQSSANFKVGEKVNVILKKSLGIKALFLGYIMPFLVVLVVLIVLSILHASELFAGLVSLSLLIPYYVALYIFRNKIKKSFTFTLRKIE